jgi:hypothetical protein
MGLTHYWALFFGMMTLFCWMAAGLIAVLVTTLEVHRGDTDSKRDAVPLALTVAGLTSAVAMALVIILS